MLGIKHYYVHTQLISQLGVVELYADVGGLHRPTVGRQAASCEVFYEYLYHTGLRVWATVFRYRLVA